MYYTHNLLNGKVDCSEALGLILINVPKYSLCSATLFHTLKHCTYRLKSPLNRLLTSCNKLKNFDFFYDSEIKLRSIIFC